MRFSRFVFHVPFVLVMLLPVSVWGQSILYTFSGNSVGDRFGMSVSSIGDVNSDGYPDVVVGADSDDNHGTDSGSVYILSGVNGSILHTFSGDSASDRFGNAVSAAGDMNNDGYADVIVGAPGDDNNGADSGSARVLSGVNGSILYTFNGDSASDYSCVVSGAGDVNADGYADVIVGAFGDDNNGSNSGSARVLSGVNGNILYTFNGDNAQDFFGASVSGAGDVNNDGYADVIVGAYQDDNAGSNSGSARIFSGVNGSILRTFNGDSAGDAFGNSVSSAGDVNNDGYGDVIVGARLDNSNYGSARVFSGANGSLLHVFYGDSPSGYFGASVSGAGDVDADGYADVMIGSPGNDNNGTDTGSVSVFSGKDGSILYTFNGDKGNDNFGTSVGSAGDINSDGYTDVIVGAHQDLAYLASGRVRIFSGKGLWTDTDSDGQNDAIDDDDDNDGILDINDPFPFIADISIDTDDDGINNSEDFDDDGDTISDITDNCPFKESANQLDVDGDTHGDVCDNDNDNDGSANLTDRFPLNPVVSLDHDEDGFPTAWNAGCDATCQGGSGFVLDNCPTIENIDQLNTDADAQGNACDLDDDNDGVIDTSDGFPLHPAVSSDPDGDGFPGAWNASCDAACQSSSGFVLDNCPNHTNMNQLNTDGDAQGNACDSDDDNDGVVDTSDSFPLQAAVSEDVDGDGFPGAWNAGCDVACQSSSGFVLDNCSSVMNVSQLNTDGDTEGNICDSDDDNDGVVDTSDSFPLDVAHHMGNWGILHAFNGDSASDSLGYSVSDAGDVNNDGYADVIIGVYQDDNNGTDSGSVRVLSGANGSILYTFNGDSATDFFGYSVSGAGDVNNDGYGDFIVGAPQKDSAGSNSGSARIFSGINGSILRTFNGDSANDSFGYSVSGAGDVNNDGYGDVIVGAYLDDNNGRTNSGSARILSGINGSILYTFNGDSGGDSFGYSVSDAGDVNNDGYADVTVGAYQDDNNSRTNSGSARVFSGVNGNILYTFNGDSASDFLGYSVSGAGDVNNDGYADVIVGAYQDDNNGTDSGSARVFSGINGSILYTFNGDSSSDLFGYSVSGAGDVNNDGYADVMAGAYQDDNNGSNSGSARIFSGKAHWSDIDNDGAMDAVDGDSDNDGVLDIMDSFPLDATESSDLDGDGVGDNGDNCPNVVNANQLNTDGDAQGDICDGDDDDDSVVDEEDSYPLDGTRWRADTGITIPLMEMMSMKNWDAL